MRIIRRGIRALAGLLFACAATGAGAAEPFISEMIEGTSNNKAIEIYNPGPDTLDLSAYSLAQYFNGSSTPALTIALSGTLAPGEVYVIAHSSALPAILAAADLTNGSGWFNGDDAIVLRKGADTIDSIGQVGVDPGTEWGTGLVSTADNTLRRKPTVCAGDTDPLDAYDPSAEWDGYATDTFDGLGAHTASCSAGPTPGDLALTLSIDTPVARVGDTIRLNIRLDNLGQGSVNLATATWTVPAGLTYAGYSLGPGAVPGGAAITWSPAGAGFVSIDLHGGPGYIVFYVDYVVGETAATPIEFEITSPYEDANPANNTSSVSLDIVREVGIHDIQGYGVGSPLPLGTWVSTEGIVTARRSNGYFIQSAPGDEDGDPATAQGLFVFTNSTPPADASVGNRLRVLGRVSEYKRTPHGFPLTQLGSSTIEAVLATGVMLPPSVGLDHTVLAADVPLDAPGRYQGMRVHLVGADVVGPSNSYGDFHVVPMRTPRPAREPGVAALDAVPLPADKDIPLFDRNPERLRVESAGLAGSSPLFFDAGARLLRLEGIMYYDRGDFTLLMAQTGRERPMYREDMVAAVPEPLSGAIRIAGYNIQDFGGGTPVTPTILSKLSEVFCSYLHNPDIVGLVEIGSLAAAQQLADAINDDDYGHCPENPQYEAHLLATTGGQRLGYLVRRAPAPGSDVARVEVLSVQQRFVADTLTNPAGDPNGVLFDRPPLHLQARVTGENGTTYDVDVLLNHTLSLLEVNSEAPRAVWGTDGARSRGKRLQQAVRLSEFIEAFQQADPDAPLVLIGDYNAFEFSDGYVDVIGIISGTPAPENEVLEWAPGAVTRPLTNLLGTRPEDQRYSYVFEGNTQNLDHVLVNDAVLATSIATLHHARVNADFGVDHASDASVPLRTSDHDPLVADLVVPAFLDADLAVRLPTAPRSATADRELVLSVEVRNLGPERALGTALTLQSDVTPDRLRVVSARGWRCAAPAAGGGGSEVRCERAEALSPDRPESLLFGVVPTAVASLGLRASVETISVDTDAANDSTEAQVRVGVAK